MAMQDILTSIDAEISNLTQIRALLSGEQTKPVSKRGRPRKDATTATVLPVIKSVEKKAKLNEAARARISAAQKARWSKVKKAAAKKEKPGKTAAGQPAAQ